MTKTSSIQMEWDVSAYTRKFLHTVSLVQIGDAEPEWRWIGGITDSQIIYGVSKARPLGQLVTECSDGKIHNPIEKYPIAQCLYRGLTTGAYRPKKHPTGILYYLVKRHLKSYKIGLSDETFNVYHNIGSDGAYMLTRISDDIDLMNPVCKYEVGACWEVFTQKLVRMGTGLYADGEFIGFMEKGVCVLRHKNFTPLLQPILEDKWQIVC